MATQTTTTRTTAMSNAQMANALQNLRDALLPVIGGEHAIDVLWDTIADLATSDAHFLRETAHATLARVLHVAMIRAARLGGITPYEAASFD